MESGRCSSGGGGRVRTYEHVLFDGGADACVFNPYFDYCVGGVVFRAERGDKYCP